MRNGFNLAFFCTGLIVTAATSPLRAADDMETMLRLMPAKHPLSIVLANPAELDKAVGTWTKRLYGTANATSVLVDLKRQLPVLAWVDLDKPLGVAVPSLAFGSRPVVFARVPDFHKKIKTLHNVTEQDGLWRLPFDDTGVIYARLEGDYVIASSYDLYVVPAADETHSVAPAWKRASRRAGGAFVHVNVDPVRAALVEQLNTLGQMLPMLSGLNAQPDAASDPTVAALAAYLSAARRFVEQLRDVSVDVSLDETTADATMEMRFADGPIDAYLRTHKPAAVPWFDGLNQRPYAIALAYHIPGSDSPFLDFLVNRMRAKPGNVDTGAAATAPTPMSPAEQATRDLFREVRGAGVTLSRGTSGVVISGNYLGAGPDRILELARRAMSAPNPLLTAMKAGLTFRPVGAEANAAGDVQMYEVVSDKTNLIGTWLATTVGEGARVALARRGDHVVVCTGSDADVARCLANDGTSGFSSAPFVAKALASLPRRANAVCLIDPAAVAAMIGATASEVPPGPPIAVSLSLSDRPARLTVHVPIEAIERYLRVVAPPEPM